MDPDQTKAWISDLLRGLRGTFLDDRLILGGSSGLFAFATTAPAFTEDLDFLVEEDLVVARGGDIVRLFEGLGFQRVPDSPTFLKEGGPGFDLVGYSRTHFDDHLSPESDLRVMVFGELGRVLEQPGSVETGVSGIRALSPAAFCAVKLLTLRVDKGAKDKLQALLVIAERKEDEPFLAALSRMLRAFGSDRVFDVVGDAQAAFLSLQRDPAFRDHGAEGYAPFIERAAAGQAALVRLLGEPAP
jgi:hypothetical protein